MGLWDLFMGIVRKGYCKMWFCQEHVISLLWYPVGVTEFRAWTLIMNSCYLICRNCAAVHTRYSVCEELWETMPHYFCICKKSKYIFSKLLNVWSEISTKGVRKGLTAGDEKLPRVNKWWMLQREKDWFAVVTSNLRSVWCILYIMGKNFREDLHQYRTLASLCLILVKSLRYVTGGEVASKLGWRVG